MKINSIVTGIAELILIGIIGLCGTLAFINSNPYAFIQSHLMPGHPTLTFYLPAMIWGVIFLFGFLSVIIRGKGGGRVTWVAIIFSLPSILSFNSLNISKIFGWEINIGTRLTFMEVLLLCVSIMTAYLFISFMSLFKQSRRSFSRRGASAEDIENINSRSHILLLLAVAATLVIGTIIALLSRTLESLIFPYFADVPWNVILIGLGCIIILAAYIYWLGSRRRMPG